MENTKNELIKTVIVPSEKQVVQKAKKLSRRSVFDFPSESDDELLTTKPDFANIRRFRGPRRRINDSGLIIIEGEHLKINTDYDELLD